MTQVIFQRLGTFQRVWRATCCRHLFCIIESNCRLLLRIKSEGTLKGKGNISKKFGCFSFESRDLLLAANTIQLDVVGVSFHVGCGYEDPSVFSETIQVAREVFNTGIELGFKMALLDIWGGFNSLDTAKVTFEETSSVISKALAKHFPEKEINVVAELGRYFVTTSFTLATTIIGKRTMKRYSGKQDGNMDDHIDHPLVEDRIYYLNEGVFQSFMSYLLLHTTPELTPFTLKNTQSKALFMCTLWGSTCADADCVMKEVFLPDMRNGDWMYFPNMGAYTSTLSTAFNGMPKPMVWFFCRKDVWRSLNTNAANQYIK